MSSSPSELPYAVILAGGGGTRLWPSSRRGRPKQLLRLGGGESLLAAAVRRCLPLFGAERTLVVTAADQEEAVRAELPDLPAENILAEPSPRNTAAAVGLAAAFVLHRREPKAVLAVLPADQFVADDERLRSTLRAALGHAREAIVTVGIRPAHPETGFGYIRPGAPVGDPADGVTEVAAFVEKPDRQKAIEYVRDGYLWNAGMFFLTAERMRAEAERHLPELGRAMDAMARASDFGAAVALGYPDVPAISIDYGIMERASGLRVVPGDFGWSDVGSWSALAGIRKTDERGNVAVGDVLLEDSDGVIAVSEAGAPLVAALGAKDLVVVATADAVLVIPRDRAQDVRRIVDALKAAGRTELL